ncbi:retrovirus-related pol polyprotein from transposon TNT 1-94 [Tanacetum coccineum]
MASTRASISKASKRPKINIIPPKQLFVDLTHDDTKTPSPTLQLSSPSAPNAPSKTPSTKDTSSSSIDYIPKSPTSSTSLSPNEIYKPDQQQPLELHQTPVVTNQDNYPKNLQRNWCYNAWNKGMYLRNVEAKTVKDAAYHKEKDVFCVGKTRGRLGFSLNAEQGWWKDILVGQFWTNSLMMSQMHKTEQGKLRRVNPCLYDIGCYNDNLALMLAPESDESIQLANKCRSKLSDLIRPFDYDQLNNLYDWSKDETPGVLIDFLTLVQRGLCAHVTTVRTDKGTEFLNKTLHAYFAKEGIRHETSTARTPEQNGVVERRNRTLVEAARTMLSAAKVPLFFWAEAIATACFTQNRSLVIPRHEKTPYHIINARKPSVKFFHIFGSLCYIVRDGENLDKMKEKGDACIFVGYSTQSKAYRVFNKRTRMIVETIHVNFDELPQMASDHVSSDPEVHQAAETVTTSNELDVLFGPLFDEYFNGENQVVLKSSAVTTTDASNKRQQQPDSTSSTSTLATTVTANGNFDL